MFGCSEPLKALKMEIIVINSLRVPQKGTGPGNPVMLGRKHSNGLKSIPDPGRHSGRQWELSRAKLRPGRAATHTAGETSLRPVASLFLDLSLFPEHRYLW